MKSSVLIALCLSPFAGAAVAQDLLITGGTVHTGLPGDPTAEAVLVLDGRIAFVGREADVPRPRNPVQAIDLKGATLFPGFTDGHAHLDGVGWRELTLNLEGSTSLTDAMAKLTAWATAHPTGVIVGRGWIETRWPESANGPRFLTAADLDAAAPGRIVLLGRADGHAVTASSAALAAAHIDATTVAPSGGEIAKDAAGKPTGFLLDAAMALIASVRPQADPEATRAAYKAGFRVEAAYGWTGVHFMSAPWKDIPMLEALASVGEAPIRVYNAVTPDGAAALFASGPRSVADGRVITRAVKFYADGALGSRGAALYDPYTDAPETRGLMQTDEATVVPQYEQALRSGIQVATHAIGDRGNGSVLDWYAEAMAAVPPDQRRIGEPRFRIEHAQIMRPSDEHRFDDLHVIASMQPSHAIGDFHFAPARLGNARLDGAYAWHSLRDLGVTVVGGSDAPVERGDPLIEFYAAVARRDLEGFQGRDWRPNEAVSREEALKMFTLAPAWASFREDELGTIEVGKRADFTAFDIDLMTVPAADIPHGHATLTVVDGKVVYERK
ncbi:amidohydrolase [soil metagenome]